MAAAVMTVQTTASAKSYPILLGVGIQTQVVQWLKQTCPKARRILVITDETVATFALTGFLEALQAAGLMVKTMAVKPGEASKSLDCAQQVYDQALEMKLSRQDVMLALGGGVVGDLTGFCAATYFRGVSFVQVPTTLLAQVDSSVGGKVAVNYGHSKNGVGVFYQPKLVLADTDLLKTLPSKQWLAGMAEVVKYALLETTCAAKTSCEAQTSEATAPSLWAMLETSAEALRPEGFSKNLDRVQPIIARCCQIKAAVVAQDETEQTGHRALLNLGHTFAHAYEALTQYERFLHGQAVAIGMWQACQVANRLGLLPPSETCRLEDLYAQLNLVKTPPADLQNPETGRQLLDLMRQDKKADGQTLTLVLPVKQLGQVQLFDQIETSVVQAVLQMDVSVS